MKVLVLILCFPCIAICQKDTFLIKEMYFKDKDTLILADIEEIEILHFKNREDERYFRRLQYKILKVYPYAKLAAEQLDIIQTQLELIPKRRKTQSLYQSHRTMDQRGFSTRIKKIIPLGRTDTL